MRRLIAISLTAILLMTGCNNSNDDPEREVTRTVLCYLVADNNLYNYALNDINEMESAWDDSYSGNLLVFLNGQGGTNVLYHIKKGTDSETIESDIVKVYSTGSHVCSTDFFTGVIQDVMRLYPADSYALDLWSHGRGWLPAGLKSPLSLPGDESKFFYGNERPVSSEFGSDSYNEESMEVNDMAEALSMFDFDFILMDACHMGSIECAYELKDVCDYYISSAAEVLAYSFPYDMIMADMFSMPANTVGIAQKFYEFYNAQSGSARTATVSVIETDKLENVAEELRSIVTSSPTIPIDNIQQYGRWITSMNDCVYDLEDFVIQTWGTQKSTAFCSALSSAVIYKAATPEIMGDIDVEHFSGVSTYIPMASQPVTNSQFELYNWATDSNLPAILE